MENAIATSTYKSSRLQFDEFFVRPVGVSHQRVVTTDILDSVVLPKDDSVCFSNGGKTMRNNNEKLACCRILQGTDQRVFSFWIECGRGLIQHQDWCIPDQSAGNAKSLLLANR